MPGRHEPEHRRFGLRWAAATAVVIGGAAALGLSASAGAATAPTPHYHAGSDTATFTVTGVEDSNCLVSTGGTEIWIKPGDAINFTSALAGLKLSSLNLTTAQVAGLNVSAVIDKGTNHAQSVSVAGGKTTAFPSKTQTKLAAGDHTISWQATSIALLPVILGNALPPATLSSANLQSGASLNWTGVIHVTTSAPQCKLAVGTPKVGVSVGPVKVTVPPINATVPVTLPTSVSVPSLGGLIPGSTKTTSAASSPSIAGYTPPGLSVAQQVMPYVGSGSGSGSFFGGALPDSNGSTQLGSLLPDTGSSAAATAPATGASAAAKSGSATTKTVQLASNQAPAAQMPVLLAIIAIIALSLVTATYARLFLLRRNVA